MTEGAHRLVAAILLSLVFLSCGEALAQTAAAAVVDPGLWDRTMAWIFAEQRAWHHDLVAQMRGLGDGGQATAQTIVPWALILASFLYGLFHAAGPGHGKVVLASYLLSHRQRVGRGVALAAASAFCQGAVAVILVYGLLYLTDLLPRDTKTAVNWTERGSFVLLGLLGLWLAARALRDGIRVWQPAAAGAHGHGHHHGDHDHHDGHDHGHVHGPGCGHSHGPSADQIEAAGSLRGAVAVILSIGLRPCSGAVLVLVLAQAMALPLAGLAAVLAMSCGTGLAVAALALVAVHARRWAAALAGGGAGGTGNGGRGLALAGLAVRLAGGLVILALGASLFAASFAPAHPLGM